ncbi:MAG: hypothetical protein ACR2P0_09390 [Acidimicrobiales bacterium]
MTHIWLEPAGHSERRVIPRPSQRTRRFSASAADTTGSATPTWHPNANLIPLERHGLDSTLTVVGLLCFGLATIGFVALDLAGRTPTMAGAVAVPMIAVASFTWTRRSIAPTYGQSFAVIVMAGLGLRFLLAVHRVANSADAWVYQREGARLAEHFRRFDFTVETGRSIPGTGSLRYLSGIVNTLTGSTFVATYLAFVVLAFAGQVLVLVAFRRWLTARQFRLAALLVMLSPSLAYWPSSIGKESAVIFGIGLGMWGASRSRIHGVGGLAALLMGVLAVGLVRPHVAMVLLGGVVAGLLIRLEHTRSRPMLRTASIAIVLVGAMWMAGASASLFGLDALDGFDDVTAALDFTQERTSQDHARFDAARVTTPLDYPWAAATVLFRPFPWEASSVLSLLSSIEGVVLLVLAVVAIPGLWRQKRTIVQSPMLVNIAVYVGIFVFVFSAIGNFGILTRQRTQVLPFVFVLMALGLAAERMRSQEAA